MKIRILPVMFVLNFLFAAVLLSACWSEITTETPAITETPTEVIEPTDEPVDVLPTAGPDDDVLIARENVRVRSGPSPQYPVYRYMAGGSTAKLVGINAADTYYAIEVPIVAPNTGWVDARFAEISEVVDPPLIEAPPVPPTANFVGPQPGDPTVIASDAVYVRSGPGEQYPAYGIAEAGSRGLVIGVSEDDSWWVVRIDPEIIGTGMGWVQKEFVDTENVSDDLAAIKTPPAPETGELPPPDPDRPYGVATEYVNLRSGPGTNYPVLGVAAPGASGEISAKSEDGNWWQVMVSTDISANGLAWVHSAYAQVFNVENVSIVETPPAPPANPNPPGGTYACILISQSPVDGTVFQAGEIFDMIWQLQNVGERPWTVADIVITKASATLDIPLSELDTMTLGSDVQPGGTYNVSIPMKAPDFTGEFGEYWIIIQDGNTICDFFNVIEVQ